MMLRLRQCLSVLILVFTATTVFAALPSADENGKTLPSLAPMLKEVNPGVVNISTFSDQKHSNSPLFNDPFFRQFFSIQARKQFKQNPQQQTQSAGSGVIVDAKNGIVLTNSRVIKNADEVHVSLVDGRSFKAKVKGSDPDLDVAVLQIDAENLTEVKIAGSSDLEVGDFVVAIGNPFGLGQTVSTGIVSAIGKNGLGIDGYENLIQIDAPINPGNSGGALVNLKGELVGINTATIAPAARNVGMGFAIPVDMAKASMEQIVYQGGVQRGMIGIGIQDVTSDLRQAFQLEPDQNGVLVSGVKENSPADEAGIQSGDIVLAVDDQPTHSTGQLRNRIASIEIGDHAELTILRNGEERRVSVEVGERKYMAQTSGAIHPLLEGAKLENDENSDGVRIVGLKPNSPAARSGLRPGDVVIGANRQPVDDKSELAQALSTDASLALLQIERNGGSLFVVIS